MVVFMATYGNIMVGFPANQDEMPEGKSFLRQKASEEWVVKAKNVGQPGKQVRFTMFH